MRVTGKFFKDDNFINIFVRSDKCVVYTIARNTGEWGSVAVGENGISQKSFDYNENFYNKEDTFELIE